MKVFSFILDFLGGISYLIVGLITFVIGIIAGEYLNDLDYKSSKKEEREFTRPNYTSYNDMRKGF